LLLRNIYLSDKIYITIRELVCQMFFCFFRKNYNMR